MGLGHFYLSPAHYIIIQKFLKKLMDLVKVLYREKEVIFYFVDRTAFFRITISKN